MGKTIAEKIFAAHLRDEPFPGAKVLALDRVQPISPLLAEFPQLKSYFSHGRLVSLPPTLSERVASVSTSPDTVSNVCGARVSHIHCWLSALTMLSEGNQCKSFGEGADGFVDAEGVQPNACTDDVDDCVGLLLDRERSGALTGSRR